MGSFEPGTKEKAALPESKKLLDTIRERNAIFQAQYEKSLGDLRLKMGFPEE